MKTCTRCGRSREIDCFQFKPKRGKPYWSGQCRDCVNAATRERTLAKTLAAGKQPPARPFSDPETGAMVKRCTGCERVLPVDAFGPRSATDRKPKPRCRECVAAAHRVAYRADPERHRAQSRDWHWRNRDRAIARIAVYRSRTRDDRLDYGRRYRAERREELNERQRDRQRNLTAPQLERRRSAARAWVAQNPDKVYEQSAHRRARAAGAEIAGPVSRSAVIARDGGRCYLCGRVVADRDVTLDHVVPLTRGGSHGPDNVRLACMDCNRRKKARTPEEFLS